MKLTSEIANLKSRIEALENRIKDLQNNSVETRALNPYSVVGGSRDRSLTRPVEPKTGLGGTHGGNLAWNDSELKIPPFGQAPGTPTEGYNRHTHNRFAGGALNVQYLELVEYDSDWSEHNPLCQQFWAEDPPIATMPDSEGNPVAKIGGLYLEFDPNYKIWFAGIREIDVERTRLVKKNEEGEIEQDANETPMSSPIYVSNPAFDDVVWDATAKMWRFYAVYAEEPEEPTP
jgi:hypothetical protein